jgi:probable metal-binding protein
MQTNEGEIHGHEVMRMMVETGHSYDATSLKAAIIQRFGPDARFYTCSASGLTADALIRFLAERGKFVSSGDGFSTTEDQICDH